MPYRLHIDIPLGDDESRASELSLNIISSLRLPISEDEITAINYRLGHDEDRQKSNYLEKNDNGHVSNKKSRISL